MSVRVIRVLFLFPFLFGQELFVELFVLVPFELFVEETGEDGDGNNGDDEDVGIELCVGNHVGALVPGISYDTQNNAAADKQAQRQAKEELAEEFLFSVAVVFPVFDKAFFVVR